MGSVACTKLGREASPRLRGSALRRDLPWADPTCSGGIEADLNAKLAPSTCMGDGVLYTSLGHAWGGAPVHGSAHARGRGPYARGWASARDSCGHSQATRKFRPTGPKGL
jgi:hypothetical protein